MILELLSALWLGILTAISPCPLAMNIATVSFLSKKINHPRNVYFSCTAYVLGRMLTYAIIGTIIVASVVNIPTTANFLQTNMNQILGPILFIIGLFMLDIIKIKLPRLSVSNDAKNQLAESGMIGAFLLGILCALSFCPISAALFFGSLIPLALNSKIGIIYPFIFGIGTGIPIAIFAMGIAFGINSFHHWFHQTAKLEILTRMLTGIIFLIVGSYFTWLYLLSPALINMK